MSELSSPSDDRQLFAQWVDQHGRAVRGFLGAMLRRDDLADDLTQEVFCRAWQARERYVEQGTARAYLLRIADRLACDHGRAAAAPAQLDDEAWRRQEPAGTAAQPLQAAVLAEQRELLAAALEQLSPLQKRVLLLRYYGQCSFAEIAATIGCPLGSALSHCHRGLEVLRKLLGETNL